MIVYLKNPTLFSERPTIDRGGVWALPCRYQGKERQEPQNPSYGAEQPNTNRNASAYSLDKVKF